MTDLRWTSTEPHGKNRPTLGVKVLIVEDDAIVASYLRSELFQLGYTITGIVSSGKDALAAIELIVPDLVLMDIQLDGDLDGIETANRLPAALELPVIYITGNSGESTIVRASGTKPWGYLIKPLDNRKLHATMTMALKRSQARKPQEQLQDSRLDQD